MASLLIHKTDEHIVCVHQRTTCRKSSSSFPNLLSSLHVICACISLLTVKDGKGWQANQEGTSPLRDLPVSCAHQFCRWYWPRSPGHATPVGRGEDRWDLPNKEQFNSKPPRIRILFASVQRESWYKTLLHEIRFTQIFRFMQIKSTMASFWNRHMQKKNSVGTARVRKLKIKYALAPNKTLLPRKRFQINSSSMRMNGRSIVPQLTLPLSVLRRNPSSFHNDKPESTDEVTNDVLEKALTYKNTNWLTHIYGFCRKWPFITKWGHSRRKCAGRKNEDGKKYRKNSIK